MDTATMDVASEHDLEAQDARAPQHSPGIMHGMGEAIKRVASEIANKAIIRRHLDKVGVIDGAGAGLLTFEGPKQGFAWYVERCWVDATGGTVKVYVGRVQDSNIKDSALSANQASLDQASPIYVPPNTELNVAFAAAPVAAKTLANLQIREVEL